MSLASRISDLTNAVAAAVNARANKVGASAFDIAVINGYTGTQTQWLAQQTANPASGLLPWRLTGNPATVTAGSLVVTVPDGVQLSIGGQVWTASGISTTVPKPASGDQWSLLVLRATWGTDGTMRVAPVLLNITPTSNTTPPTVPPTAFPAFSATYGTQVDVPLTWVWVTATSTVPTIYDASLRYTNLGGFSLANPYILQAYHNAGTNPIRGLGTIGIGQFDTQTLASDGSGTSAIRDSIWMRRGGTSGVIWKPLGTLRAQVLQGVTDLTGIFNTLGQVRGFSQETECFCEANSFTYRYVGVGATNLGNLDTTSAWQAWDKGGSSWTPTPSNMVTGTGASLRGAWGISSGRFWASGSITFGTSPSITNAAEVTLTLPSTVSGEMTSGSGKWQASGGSTSSANQVDLYPYAVVNTPGAASNSVRLRARVATAVGAALRQYPLGSAGVTPTASDLISFDLSGASTAVA